MKLSAIEIYNEAVRDLLSTDSTPLRLLDDPEVSFYLLINDLTYPNFNLTPFVFAERDYCGKADRSNPAELEPF